MKLKGIVFISQMVFLYKDPRGEHIFEGPRTGSGGPTLERKQSSAAILDLLSSDQQKVEWLTVKVQELEKELAFAQVSSFCCTLTQGRHCVLVEDCTVQVGAGTNG